MPGQCHKVMISLKGQTDWSKYQTNGHVPPVFSNSLKGPPSYQQILSLIFQCRKLTILELK